MYNGEQTRPLFWPFIKQTRDNLSCYKGPKKPSTPLSFCMSIGNEAFQRGAICLCTSKGCKTPVLTIKVFKATYLAILCSKSLLIGSPTFDLGPQFCRPLAYRDLYVVRLWKGLIRTDRHAKA